MKVVVLVLVAGVALGSVAGWKARAVAASDDRLVAGYDAAFIEQVEVLKAMQNGSMDAYKGRLAIALRDQMGRLGAEANELGRHSELVRQQAAYVCEHQAALSGAPTSTTSAPTTSMCSGK